jgi:Zn-dependent peptidase ImmA (M78 family)/DNA-binding XRE family transcriptional regulator
VTDTTTAWVAQAIRRVREQRGWSQSELARRLERTQTSVSYWESGKRTPGLDELLELSDVLDVGVDTFIPPERTRRPVTAVLRATVARLADTDLEHAVDALVEQAEGAGLPEVELEISGKAPTHAANELLEKAGVSDPPVSVQELARRCGVLVLHHDLPDSLSGLVFALDGGGVIGINAGHHPNRQRFSLAHELGHFLLGHHQGGIGHEDRFHIDSSDAMPPGYDAGAERSANEFAAELLMPRKFVSAAFRETTDPGDLAAQFEVSEVAMGYRLVNLGLR